MILASALAVVLTAPPQERDSSGSTHTRYDHEDVLGTSCTLRVLGQADRAGVQEAAVLAEIQRLDDVLSTYSESSELRRLEPGVSRTVSPDLGAVLAECDRWRETTGGAFDAGIAPLLPLWDEAQATGAEPTTSDLEDALARIAANRWTLDGRRLESTDVEPRPDGLAKGYVLDAAARAALDAGAEAVFLDIGGDLVARGEAVSVAIHDPRQRGENRTPLTTIEIVDAAVATSGNYARGYSVGGELLGHVLDPRSGRPVMDVMQASVVAPRAVDADALATALMVLGPTDGLALVASMPRTECLLLDSAGGLHRSDGWAALTGASATGDEPATARVTWPADRQVLVEFEFARPERTRGRRPKPYRRPYIAVWVEDESGAAVRTLCLWIQRERWLRDLRKWHRLHGENRSLIDSVTRATRNPGRYELLWDGCDDDGQRLPLGTYTIFVEAAREHGSYQVTSAAIDTSAEAATVDLDGNVEVKAARISFGGNGTSHSNDDSRVQ